MLLWLLTRSLHVVHRCLLCRMHGVALCERVGLLELLRMPVHQHGLLLDTSRPLAVWVLTGTELLCGMCLPMMGLLMLCHSCTLHVARYSVGPWKEAHVALLTLVLGAACHLPLECVPVSNLLSTMVLATRPVLGRLERGL